MSQKQKSIDKCFRQLKRPASESSSRGKTITRKLFAQDDGLSSPVKSPVKSSVATMRKLSSPVPVSSVVNTSEGFDEKPSEPVEEILPEGTEKTATTPQRSAADQERLQKELNLGGFRKLIRQSKKYSTLKAALEKHNSTIAQLEKIEQAKKDLTSSPELKRFRTYEFEVETSPIKRGSLRPRRLFSGDSTASPTKNLSYVSPRKLLDEGPVASPTKPAFDRLKQFVIEGKDELILPPKYALLRELFNGVETVTKILIDRKETVKFSRIQSGVQKMTRRRFTEQHLAMIKAVYPGAFDLRYELVKQPFSRDETLELIIDRSKSPSTDMSERKKIFATLLLNKTKQSHHDFLQTLDPPILVPLDKMNRWHPLFDLNSVPDVVPEPIPRPILNNEMPLSVTDFLEKTKKMVACNKRMEHAVSQLMDKQTPSKAEEKTESQNAAPAVPSPSVDPIPALQRALKGVPKSVLEKIRAKKAAKMVESITQTPEQAKEQMMLSRLPELAKIMRLVFVKEGKKVLPESLVVPKVRDSFKEKLSTDDLVAHLKLLSTKCPGWMSFFTVHNLKYIRLEKDADMTRVVGKLQKLAQAV